MTLRAFLAAQPPMDTWSSVAALVDKESTEDGWHKTLFSETREYNNGDQFQGSCWKHWVKREINAEKTFYLKVCILYQIYWICFVAGLSLKFLITMLHCIVSLCTLTQSSSSAMSNHESWVESSLIDEEGRQLTQRRVTQPFNPPLTDWGQLMDCNG